MSQAPHRDPPPPQPTPDNPYELQPVQPPAQERDLTSEILTISVIVACLVLLGVGAMLWVRDNRPARPRPTATASQPAQAIASPTATATASHTAVARPTRTSASVTPATRTAQGTPSPSSRCLLSRAVRARPPPPHPPRPSTSPPISSDQSKDRHAHGLRTLPTPVPTLAAQALRFLALPFLSRQDPPSTPTPLPATATSPPTATAIPGATSTPTTSGTPVGHAYYNAYLRTHRLATRDR